MQQAAMLMSTDSEVDAVPLKGKRGVQSAQLQECTFEVTVSGSTSRKKAQTKQKVTMKVGNMGVSFHVGPKHLETHLYQQMASWEPMISNDTCIQIFLTQADDDHGAKAGGGSRSSRR